MMDSIRVDALVKRFVPGLGERATPPIGPLNFSVEQGQICALLGANGAGKSTCIKALLGLIRPTQGRTWILGEPTESPAWRGRVGYLSEQARVPDHLTPTEALRYLGSLNGLPKRRLDESVPRLLSRLDLSEASGRLIRTFSKGMQQRVGLATALLGEPEVLVLDEPMSGLDPIGRRLVRDLMIEEKSRGVSILFSTHIIPDAEALADVAVVIARGKVVAMGPLNDLMGPAEAFDVTFVQGSEELVSTPFRVRGGAREMRVPAEELEKLLARIRSSGARLITVEPVRRSIESLITPTQPRSVEES